MVGYCLCPATWVCTQQKHFSSSFSCMPAHTSHPLPVGAPEQVQRGCPAPQSPAASLSLPPVPHIMPKPRARPLGDRCRSLPKVALGSSTSISEALPASCLEDFPTRQHELRDVDHVTLMQMGENTAPSLPQALVCWLRPLLTGPSLQRSEMGLKVRLEGGRVAAAHGSLSPIRDAMQRQEAFVWWKPPPEH